ncbi:MAG: 4Fe-4S binding protein [Candidatus Helarchaeota archaeon]
MTSSDQPKIGVFICHCGTNIAGVIDVKRIVNELQRADNIHVVRHYEFMCSEHGQELIKKAIEKQKINRIVVACCSPKFHEKTFQRCLAAGGINPFFVEIANIREQCSWVHKSKPNEATEKAIKIIKGAVGKALHLKPIEVITVPIIREVVVIGGGIAGIQAALDIADTGTKVHIIEKYVSLGGNMARTEKTFPTNDCAMCILSPKLNDVRSHDNITIHTMSEVKKVDGFLGNFVVTVEKNPRFVDEKKCINCGRCIEICPVEVLDEWQLNMGFRKAIHVPFAQALPSCPAIDEKNCTKCGKCEEKCPTNAINLKETKQTITLRVGAIITSIGWEEWDPSPIVQYRYGQNKNVITQFQFARLLDPFGPTDGKILTAEGKSVKRIVMIQCVGSRDKRYNQYCSTVCCMAALKHAQLAKMEHDSEIDVIICHQEMRTPKKRHEQYFTNAREIGVKFIRGRPSEVLEDPDSDQLIVRVEDEELQKLFSIKTDLVVLSTATVASKDTEKLARILGIDVDAEGFVAELHPKLAPVETKVAGIFVCGALQGPKDIPDSVAQGGAAAAKVIATFSNPVIKKNLEIPEINQDLCVLCGTCVESCNFSALTKHDKLKKIVVHALKCVGCGMCMQACPTGACQLKTYRDDQLHDQIQQII